MKREMGMRVFGGVLLIASSTMMFIFARSFSYTSEMAEVLAMGIENFDAIEWQRRWRWFTVGGLCVGVAMFSGSLGLVKRRSWGWLWLAAGLSISGLAVVCVRLLTHGRFAFEPSLSSGIAYLGLGIWFWRVYQKSDPQPSAAPPVEPR